MKTYTINEIAGMFEVAHSTLHYYEKIGILTNVEREKSGRRIYTDEHIKRLGAITCFKKTGMSISDIQSFFRYEQEPEIYIDDIVSLMEEHEVHVLEQIERLQSERKHIHRKVQYYCAIKTAIAKNETWPEWREFANL